MQINKELKDYIFNVIVPKLEEKEIVLYLDFDNNFVYANKLPCSGYFDDKKGFIKCAVGNKKPEDWFGTLLHEFSHFEQWSENCIAWQKSQSFSNDVNSDEVMDQWLDNKDFDNIAEILESIAFLEYDCERRTSEKMKIFPMFNVDEYIQKSNAYVAFYKKLLETRKWYNPDKAPYLLEEVWKKMPTDFLEWKYYFAEYKFNHVDWTKTQD